MGMVEDKNGVQKSTLDLNRAIDSLREELEAVNYYQQRADSTENQELKKILEHNRDEEKEHAAMLLQWIKTQDASFAKELNEWLSKDKIDLEGHEH